MHRRLDPAADRSDPGVDVVLRQLRPAEHRLEHQEQHDAQQQRAGDRIEHHGIKPRQNRLPRGNPVADVVEDPANFALRRFDVRGACRLRRFQAADALAERESIDPLHELTFSARTYGDGLDDGNTERNFQRPPIDPKAALLGHIAHVQSDQYGSSDAFQFQYEPQIQTQIGRIDDADQQIRTGLDRVPAEDHIARDGLVQRGCLEAVSPGQVDDSVNTARVWAHEAAFLPLDRHARVVRDFLPAAGQPVEQCRLAAIRYADQGEARGGGGGG